MPWGSQIPALLSKRTDVIAQNIHVNPERVKVISFTGPAWWYGPVVLVEKGNPDGIKSYDDLKGKDVGAIARLGGRGLSASGSACRPSPSSPRSRSCRAWTRAGSSTSSRTT